jgi:formimidoylglutamase
LLGLPDDTGVKLNHGRPGAAQGPAAFRQALASFGTAWDGYCERPLNVQVFDAGDIQPARGVTEDALLETHARVERAVLEMHRLGLVPVCVGGGHDLTLPAVTALARYTGAAVGGISLDAHLDVRPEPGSGMAFRCLIEFRRLDPRKFAVVGLGRFSNEASHVRWLKNQGARLFFADSVLDGRFRVKPLKAVLTKVPAAFVSIDLDGIDSAAAPGVSALNPMGVTVRDAATLAQAAGADRRVRHFDLMELSPPHEPSGRTARVAAFLFLSFVAGFASRRL